MDLRVKLFIEESIDLIESENWKGFFSNLINSRYNSYVPNFMYLALFILDDCGIDYYSLFEGMDKTEIHKTLNYLTMLAVRAYTPGNVLYTNDSPIEPNKLIRLAIKLGYKIYLYIDSLDEYLIIKPNWSLGEFLEYLLDYQDTVPPESEFKEIV